MRCFYTEYCFALTVTHVPHGRNIKLFQELRIFLEEINSDILTTLSDESTIELVNAIKKVFLTKGKQ
ncbi:hypothetical protein AN964_13255 [Heyndrickxia shackletonii]|uniref:Uncharacterized protein n=1 Tax=Heyndrickxia shackletonii TaxID=157838 RepID=A0A0Q3TK39_9BACI|nr:hypothetical protein AN964_13255 [Heyndrickxia shackletonii]